MSKIDRFFEEMRALFLKGDMEAFYDIKEDLKEHIDIQLAEGLSEEVIIEKLGSPEELVAEFYEEQRLHTAMMAETDVVAIENVKDVYLHERKERIYEVYERIQLIATLVFQAILIVLGGFATSYLLLEFLSEKHLALIPLMIGGTAFYGLWLIFCLKKDRYKKGRKQVIYLSLVFLGLMVVTSGSIATHSFFYHGKLLNQKIIIDQPRFQTLSIKSQFPLNLNTLPTNESKLKIEVKGYGKNRAKSLLNKLSVQNQSDLLLDFGNRTLFDSFTAIEPLEVVLHIPSQISFKQVDMAISEGMIQTQHLSADTFHIQLDSGEFNAENLRGKELLFDSKQGDLIMTHYESDLLITNQSGKVILKKGRGAVEVKTDQGFVNLIGIEAQDAKVTSQSSKVIVAATTVAYLDIASHGNAVIIEGQTGQTAVTMAAGKLVMTNNRGRLDIQSKSASIIVNQDQVIEGQIQSESGLVKWVQEPEAELSFDLSSKKGEITNEMKEKKRGPGPNFVIKSDRGDISLYDKVTE